MPDLGDREGGAVFLCFFSLFCFVFSVCPCMLFKMKYICFQRPRKALNFMTYDHVCGSHVSI